MPIYEYTCAQCGHVFELLVLQDFAHFICPQCGSENIEKNISVCAFSMGTHSGTAHSRSSCSACSSKKCSDCR